MVLSYCGTALLIFWNSSVEVSSGYSRCSKTTCAINRWRRALRVMMMLVLFDTIGKNSVEMFVELLFGFGLYANAKQMIELVEQKPQSVPIGDVATNDVVVDAECGSVNE